MKAPTLSNRFKSIIVRCALLLQFLGDIGGTLVDCKGLHEMIVKHAVLCVIDGKLAMVHFVVGDTVFENAKGYYVKLDIVWRVVEHGQCRVNVEKQENDDGVGLAQVRSREDGRPGAGDAHDVLDGMFVSGIEISACGKVLSMVVFVNQWIDKWHVENVVNGSITNVQDNEHDPECSHRIQQTNIF